MKVFGQLLIGKISWIECFGISCFKFYQQMNRMNSGSFCALVEITLGTLDTDSTAI